MHISNEIHNETEAVVEKASISQPPESPNQPKSFWDFFIDNNRLTYLILIAIVLMGIFGVLNIDVEANPEVEQPIGIVQTFYPNSSPEDIEKQVTNELEEAINSQGSIEEITSSSGNNLSTITVTYESNADTDEVLDELKDIVSTAQNQLPDGAEDPQVLEIDFNAISIVTYSISSNQRNLKDLNDFAEQVSDELKQVSGVSQVQKSGELTESVKVILNPQKMNALQISLNEVINAINSSNVNAPLGEINRNNSTIDLRLLGKIESINQLRNIPIRNANNNNQLRLITLDQIADQIDLLADNQETLSGVSDGQNNASESITLQVFKQKGGNIINIVNDLDSKISELEEILPTDITIVKTNDNAFYIRKDLRTLSLSGAQTIVIIFFALLIFLSFTESFVAALAIPIIFAATLGASYLLGYTLNGLSIFSLILSLGLIVDTSIVIVEGIHEFKNQGYSNIAAAKKTLAVYKWPLTAGTATSIAAFFPMLLVGGIVGEFIKTIPITLNITLISSLFVSFAISPLLASKLIPKGKSSLQAWKENQTNRLKDFYKRTITSILHSRPARGLIILVSIVLFAASMYLPISGALVPQLFPSVDNPFIFINFEREIGSTLEETEEFAQEIEAILLKKDYLENYTTIIGRQQSDGLDPGQTPVQSHTGSFVLNLTDISITDRQRSYTISNELRTELTNLETADKSIEILDISSGPPTAAPLEVRIIGPNLNELENISLEIKKALEEINGLINISTAFDDIPEEASLRINQDILSYYGLTNQQISQILRTATVGTTISTAELNDEEYDLDLFYNSQDTKNLNEIQNIEILTPRGPIPLSYLITVDTARTITSIPHIDLERSVRVRAFTEQDVLIGTLQPEINAALASIELPSSDYSISAGGEDEDIQESFADLFSSMIIAVILILAILVLIFRSYRQTFIILATIPLAIIGIFPGLTIAGLPLSFPAFLGVVMLAGIVVNDAIVLMDKINIERKSSNNTKAAIVSGASSRLVPVLLTSITTILGLLPITLTDEFWRGLGYSVIFGLLAATFLTLLIIPTLYSILYRDKH